MKVALENDGEIRSFTWIEKAIIAAFIAASIGIAGWALKSAINGQVEIAQLQTTQSATSERIEKMLIGCKDHDISLAEVNGRLKRVEEVQNLKLENYKELIQSISDIKVMQATLLQQVSNLQNMLEKHANGKP